VYIRDGFTCRICGWKPPNIPEDYDGRYALAAGYPCPRTGRSKIRILELDHIKPRLHGGSNDVSNLQALCNSCNARKGATI
jgi:5-methylcytosine-specific restriction endonuclease McrA